MISEKEKPRQKRRSVVLLISCVLFLTACEQPITGTWVDADGIATYDFNGDGQVRISALGAQVEADYSIDGDRVVVSGPQGALVLTREDQELRGPMGLVLSPVPIDGE